MSVSYVNPSLFVMNEINTYNYIYPNTFNYKYRKYLNEKIYIKLKYNDKGKRVKSITI